MIYDVKTKNKSFLKMSVILRNKGVKNNKFFLALYDESLVGVDPHSKDLTAEQKMAIYKEICINKWYYLREVVKVPVSGNFSSYILHLGNLTSSFLKTLNINFIELLPRQHGKTMGEICDDTWVMNFATNNTTILYLNKEFKNSKDCLKQYKNIKLALPVWLRELIQDRNDKDNEEIKISGRLNNTLMAMPAATTTEGADKLGRGLTAALLYCDEFAFLKYNEIIYTAALPAWKTAADNARKNNVPYGITITTTPNNLDTPQGAYCKKIIDNAAPFYIEFFDYTEEQIREYLAKNSANDFMFVQFSYKELGKSEAWLQQSIREFQGDMLKVKRELLLEWPRSTEFSVFSEAQLDRIFNSLKEPRCILNISGYKIKFFQNPDLRKNYILGCDVSGGLSKDSSTIVFVDPEDFSVAGNFKNNKIDTDSFRKLVETIMSEYFRNSLLVMERNSFGLNILQTLIKTPLEPRILQEQRERLGERTTKDGFTIRKKTKTLNYGVDTTVQSRKVMFELLPNIVDEEFDKINSIDLYQDIAGLERKKNEKIEHSESSHDDTLMAYLIVRYSLFAGKYLRDHGISALPTAKNIRKQMSSDDFRRIEEIIDRANRIEDPQLTLDGNATFEALKQQDKMFKQSSNEQINNNLDAFMSFFEDNY